MAVVCGGPQKLSNARIERKRVQHSYLRASLRVARDAHADTGLLRYMSGCVGPEPLSATKLSGARPQARPYRINAHIHTILLAVGSRYRTPLYTNAKCGECGEFGELSNS